MVFKGVSPVLLPLLFERRFIAACLDGQSPVMVTGDPPAPAGSVTNVRCVGFGDAAASSIGVFCHQAGRALLVTKRSLPGGRGVAKG